MTVIEFICFSDFREPQVDGLAGIENLKGFYAGNQLEDPTHGYLVFLWSSLEAQHAAKSGEAYKKLVSSAGDNVVTTHVLPEPAPEENIGITFGAPVTEFAIARLWSEEKRARWLEVNKMTHEGVSQVDGAIGGVHASKNEVHNGTFFFLIGWVTLEHHKAALSMPYADDILKETHELTDFNARHANLTKYL